MKKVLVFLPGGVGGAERMSVNIARFLPVEQYLVKFVIVGKNDNIRAILPSGYEVIHLAIHNIWCFPIIRFLRLINREKADFVFSSVMYINIRLLIAAKFSGVKAIIRNDNYLAVSSWRQRLFLRLTYPWATRIIAQQEEMADDLISGLHLPVGKVVVRHNPLNTEDIIEKSKGKSPYPNDNSINLLWIGNYLMSKGFDIMVSALEFIVREIPNCQLYVLGNVDVPCPFIDKAKAYSHERGIADRIHFLGLQKNPYPWMKHCDCYVSSSRIEGLPNAMIEAMFLKRPVAATRCIPIIHRMVKDGYNGYTATTENAEELAKSVVQACQLKEFDMIYKPSNAEDFIELFQ